MTSLFLDLLCCQAKTVCDCWISVSSQASFDSLSEDISSAALSGKRNIHVEFRRGKYHYGERHLNIGGTFPELDLTINGNGSVLVGEMKFRKGSFSVNPGYSYFDPETMTPVNLWSDTRHCGELIEIIDPETGLCRMKLDSMDIGGDFSHVKISQWYTSRIYEVSKVEGEYLWFLEDNLQLVDGGKGYNVNYDFFYGQKYPRYRVCVKNLSSLFESGTVNFCSLVDAKLKSLEIRGFSFVGCAHSNGTGLILFESSAAEYILVENCRFSQLSSVALDMRNVSNINIIDNTFEGNALSCISVDAGCSGFTAKGNLFKGNGTAWRNSFCIECAADGFLIDGNRFVDFGYCAIGFGQWYASEAPSNVCGVIENNEISYSPEYLASCWKYTLMDSGAVYAWTRNSDVTVRYNFIHDYSGVKDNRGIFCDDGACNVKIYGNVVLGIENSFCIDSRRVESVITAKESYAVAANVGNEIKYNVLDGSIRFEGSSCPDNGCVYGGNCLLVESGRPSSDFVMDEVIVSEEDIAVSAVRSKLGKFKIFNKNKLRSLPVWNEVKRFL